MRSRISAVIAVIACLLLPFALVSSWVAGVVTDSDRYVATVGPLADDPVVVAAVERNVQAQVMMLVDQRVEQVEATLADRSIPRSVRTGLESLLATLRSGIATTVNDAVTTVVSGQDFPEIWRDANTAAHRQLINILTGKTPGIVDDNGQVGIELSAVVDQVLTVLGREGLFDTTRLPQAQVSFAFLKAADLERAQRAYTIMERAGFWLPLAWLVMVVSALVLAISRRSAIRILAIGAVIGVVLLTVAMRLGEHHVASTVAPLDREAVKAVWSSVFSRLHVAVLTVLVIALVVLALDWLTGGSRGARGTRSVVRRERA